MVKASVLEDVGRLSVRDYPRPEVEAGALLLEMDLCGVCGTDIHLYRGNMKNPIPGDPGPRVRGADQGDGEEGGEHEGEGAIPRRGGPCYRGPGHQRVLRDMLLLPFHAPQVHLLYQQEGDGCEPE